MVKFLHFKTMALLLLMIVGASSAWAEDYEEVYNLNCPKSGSNSAYANYYDVTIDGIKWNAPGNQNIDGYWRIGGKSLSDPVNRVITGKDAINKEVTKITFNHNGKSRAAVTVPYVKLTVASDASFETVIDEITVNTPDITKGVANSFDFTPTSPLTKWENCYYKITINVSNSDSSNGGLDVTSIVFYETVAVASPSVTLSTTNLDFGRVYYGETKDLTFEVTPANLTSDLSISCNNAKYEVSPTTILQSATTAQTITVTAKPTAINDNMDGTITISGGGLTESKTVTLSTTVGDPSQIVYDFTQIENFSSWGNSYSQHLVEYDDATVTFASAGKQTGTITNQPVTKGGDVTLVLKNTDKVINSVEFVCTQWTTKEQTITLYYSTDGGTNYTSTGITSSNFTIASNSLPTGTNAVKISFSSTTNQVGIASATISISELITSPLASIAISGTYPTVFAKGDTFSHEGMTVTATYEDNSTSDVTLISDFSGYNMETVGTQTVTVSYTERGVTKTTSYSIKVKDVAGLAFNPATTSVYIGAEQAVSFTKATDGAVTFNVADPTIATYDSTTGKITGLKEGTTTLTATSVETESYAAGEATCTITVTDPNWIDFTIQGYENANDVTTVNGVNGSVTFGVGDNSNGNGPKWYDSGSAVRLYTGNTITITAKTGYLLNSIEFHVTSGSMLDTSFDKTVTKGSGNDFTLSAPASEITYTTTSNFRIDKIKLNVAATATITSAGYATWVPGINVEVPSGVSAYIVSTTSTTSATLVELLAIPAGTPVVLKGAANTYTFSGCNSEDCDDVTANKLRVVTAGQTITNAYVLAKPNDNPAAFYLYSGAGLDVGQVYLPVTSNARMLSFSFDESTAIENVYDNLNLNGEVYDLQGRRVAQPSKGLYIVNGKKIVIK